MPDIRDAHESDLPAIAAIYGHHVLKGLASFEEEPPSLDETRRRHADVRGLGLPYLACVDGGEVIGYAYASLFRTRSAYRYTLEDSVYVKPGREHQGVGRRLLEPLLTVPEVRDLVVLRVTVEGKRAGAGLRRVYEMIDFFDEATGMTAMMRTTAFPAAESALLLARGGVAAKGVLAAEQVIDGGAYPGTF